ncbi:MAG: substrate-binding domain-containing protein [bacterium]|nr:substrate-binding domain-containing protein [bacterium]
MRLRANVLLTGLLVLGLVAAACGEAEEATTTTAAPAAEAPEPAAPDDPIVVGVPALIATHPFYVEQYRYFQHEADRQGAELIIVDSAPTKEVNEVQMLDDAYSLLERGVDAIIMEYINPEPFLDFQVEAASRGVCVLNESQTPLTGAQNWNEDNYQGGYGVGVHAGEWAAARGYDSPKIALIARPDNPPILARSNGFVDGVKSVVPGAEVVAEAQAMGPEAIAAAFANMAAANPDARIWFAPEIDSGVAGLAALAEQGLDDPEQVFLAVTNVSEAGLEVLARGDTPLQAAYMYSKNNLASIQMFRDALACARGETRPPTVYMLGQVVDPNNLADIQQLLQDLDSSGEYPQYVEDLIDSVIEYRDEPQTTPGPEDPIVVGVPALIATHPFYVEQYRYFQHEADRQGAELIIVDSAPTKEVNEVQMLDDAYSLLERGVDAIIMEYINPEPFLDFQVEAASRGVCVLNESQTPLTGAQNWNEDNYQGGYGVGVHAGEWAAARGYDSPKIALIARPDNPPILARSNGFVDGVKSVVPGAEVVAEAQAMGPEAIAAAFANMAAANPDARIWFAPEIDSGVAGLAALAEQGLDDPEQVFLAVTNVSEAGLEVLARGDTPLQAAYMYSKNNLASIQMFRDALACARGETRPPTVYMLGQVVDPNNLADIQQLLQDLDSSGEYPQYVEDLIDSVIEYRDEPQTTPSN